MRGLHDADAAAAVLAGHEEAHHLVHDDDGDLLGGEQEEVLGVDVLDPLPALHVLVPGDGVAQRLEPAEEERLDVGQLGGEVAVEHLALELAVLLGGARPGLRLRLDLALPQPPVVRPPRPLPLLPPLEERRQLLLGRQRRRGGGGGRRVGDLVGVGGGVEEGEEVEPVEGVGVEGRGRGDVEGGQERDGAGRGRDGDHGRRRREAA